MVFNFHLKLLIFFPLDSGFVISEPWSTHRWWGTRRRRRRRRVFDDLDKQTTATKKIKMSEECQHKGEHTDTHKTLSLKQTLTRTRLTEVIRDRWLSQTGTSLSLSHGGDAALTRLLCSCNWHPIAPLTTDYKDSACKPTSGAPNAK